MGSLDIASGIVGVLLPALVAFIVRCDWPSWAKGLVAVGSSIAAALLVAWVSGSLTGKTFAQSALIVFIAAQAAYKFWWQPTGIAPAIEKATTHGVIEGELAGKHREEQE